MSRRDWCIKWSVYGLGLLLVWLVDFHILPYLSFLGVSPMLLPVAVAVVAVLEGSNGGTGFGMAAGLVWALLSPGGSAWMVMSLALGGMLAGILSQFALQRSLPGSFLCAGLLLILLDAGRILHELLSDTAAVRVMLPLAAAEIVLSFLWTPLLYLVFRRIYRRVGGTKLA